MAFDTLLLLCTERIDSKYAPHTSNSVSFAPSWSLRCMVHSIINGNGSLVNFFSTIADKIIILVGRRKHRLRRSSYEEKSYTVVTLVNRTTSNIISRIFSVGNILYVEFHAAGANAPVVCVSWLDRQFCRKKSNAQTACG